MIDMKPISRDIPGHAGHLKVFFFKCGHFKISNHNSNHINSTSAQRPHSIVESTELFIEETSPEQETTSGQPNEENPEVFDSESSSRQGYINQVG